MRKVRFLCALLHQRLVRMHQGTIFLNQANDLLKGSRLRAVNVAVRTDAVEAGAANSLRSANIIRTHEPGRKWEVTMTRLAAIALALAFASVAQAMPLAPVHQPESLVTTVREACGAGFTRVNGVCVRTPARAAARRCAAGVRCR